MDAGELLHISDVGALLNIVTMAAAAERRKHWCVTALTQLCSLLGANAAIALDVVESRVEARNPGDAVMRPGGPQWRVTDFFDVGLSADREILVESLNRPVVDDPLLLSALRRRAMMNSSGTAFLCTELLSLQERKRSPFCRRKQDEGYDALISMAAVGVAGQISVGMFLRKTPRNAPFGERERTLIEVGHPRLAEISARQLRKRPEHGAALSPRLRETFRHLAADRSERAVAKTMKISPHTVHDYVKALYAHFGVSTRRDLIARWATVKGA